MIGSIDEIAVVSILFSIVSIIIAVTSIITEKFIINSQGYAVVEFDITGSSVSTNSDKCRNKTSYIGDKLSDEMGLKRALIEIQRPRRIPNGLRMTINIHLDLITVRDIDYHKILNDLCQNGKLAENLKNFWNLNHIPHISEIKFRVEESQDRKGKEIKVKMGEENHPHPPDRNEIFSQSNLERMGSDIGEIELEAMPEVNVMTPGAVLDDESEYSSARL